MYGYETRQPLTIKYTSDGINLELTGDGQDVLKGWAMYIGTGETGGKDAEQN
jgi:hypothetical protein